MTKIKIVTIRHHGTHYSNCHATIRCKNSSIYATGNSAIRGWGGQNLSFKGAQKGVKMVEKRVTVYYCTVSQLKGRFSEKNR